MRTYEVTLTDADGGFFTATTEAVSPCVAVAEVTTLLNDALITPLDVVNVVCRVVRS